MLRTSWYEDPLTVTFCARRSVRAAVVGGIAYFGASDGTHGMELWASDGTATGTVMVADLNPGPFGSYPGSYPGGIVQAGDKLFFNANDNLHGDELFVLKRPRTDTDNASTAALPAVISPSASPAGVLGNSAIQAL